MKLLGDWMDKHEAIRQIRDIRRGMSIPPITVINWPTAAVAISAIGCICFFGWLKLPIPAGAAGIIGVVLTSFLPNVKETI